MFEQRIKAVESLLADAKLFPIPPKKSSFSRDQQECILKALWVMASAEFEGSFENMIEKYLDKIAQKSMSKIHHCILMRCFFEDSERPVFSEITNLAKKPKKNLLERIKNKPFTKNFDQPWPDKIIRIYEHLGISFDNLQKQKISFLESFCERRNLIAHGQGVSITDKELLDNTRFMKIAYRFLKLKLARHS